MSSSNNNKTNGMISVILQLWPWENVESVAQKGRTQIETSGIPEFGRQN